MERPPVDMSETRFPLFPAATFFIWLQFVNKNVDLSGAIPSKWTLERVTSFILTTQLQPLFALFREQAKKIGIIAIDGKTLRGSRSWGKGHPLGAANLYTNEFKNWRFDKEAAQIFASGTRGHCSRASREVKTENMLRIRRW